MNTEQWNVHLCLLKKRQNYDNNSFKNDWITAVLLQIYKTWSKFGAEKNTMYPYVCVPVCVCVCVCPCQFGQLYFISHGSGKINRLLSINLIPRPLLLSLPTHPHMTQTPTHPHTHIHAPHTHTHTHVHSRLIILTLQDQLHTDQRHTLLCSADAISCGSKTMKSIL